MDWLEAVKKGETAAAVFNVVLVVALVLTRRWWRAEPASAFAAMPGEKRSLTGFWAPLLFIVIIAAGARMKFAQSSLWWDEVWNVRHATVGEFRPEKKSGELKFHPTTWAEAAWMYRKPTNHPPVTLASKLSHNVWAKFTRAEPGSFSELALRLPCLLASLAAVAAVALLLAAWGLPVEGLIGAAILALHPWHIRYGVDARSYTFLVPLTLLAAGSLTRLCGQRSRAVDWWMFGLFQGLIMWCHVLSIWVCAGLFAAGAWLLWRRGPAVDRWRRLARLVAVNAAGAGLFAQLFLPNLLQATQWGEKNQDGNLLTWDYFKTTLSQLAFGLEPAWPGGPETASLVSFSSLTGGHAWIAWVVTAAVLVLLVAGFLRLRRHHPDAAVIIAALSLMAALFLGGVAATHGYFYHRFLIAALVPWCALLGIAAWTPRLRLLAVPALLAADMFLMLPQRRVLDAVPYAPLRDVAAALAPEPHTTNKVLGYGLGGDALQGYRADVIVLKGNRPMRPDIEAAMAASLEKKEPLFVALGYEGLNRERLPDGFTLLDDPRLFQQTAAFPGIDPLFYFRILRYTGAPLKP